jgi:methylglutaconyl-CoA hydratase
MPFKYLITRREGPVEYLTLSRPEVRNAFNEEVVAELSDWANRLEDEPLSALRVAVLGGAGKAFCAGADVEWMSKTVSYTREENLRDAMAMSRMFAALNGLKVPLVGRIHGAALGGGAGLTAVCDIAVAEEQAVFGFTEVKLGIVPAVIAPFVLAKIGPSAARQLFLTGARFPAARAREIGLVHAVVPVGALDAAVAECVREILAAGPEAVATAKELVAQLRGRSIEDAMMVTAQAIATRRVSREGQEGLRAFLEKRTPSWLG